MKSAFHNQHSELALFAGKARDDLLVGADPFQRLGHFRANVSMQLSQITGKDYHRSEVCVGKVRFGERSFPAVVIGALIHQVQGLSYAESVVLGRRIKAFHLAEQTASG